MDSKAGAPGAQGGGDSAALGRLLRELTPRVLTTVARRYRDFAAAEDAVQDACLAAAQQWPRDGVPAEPRAWLIRVAFRRLADRARSEAARRRRELQLVETQILLDVVGPEVFQESEDDPLTLLFMCCHPVLTTSSAVALTLRAVGGLTTAEIAHAFLVPEATLAQRISRAKEAIRTSGVAFERPDTAQHAERLSAVLQVLYLIYNEAYAASAGPALLRQDLATDAIRLSRMALRSTPGVPELEGLLALMLLTEARRPARLHVSGALIPLDEQDRSLWRRDLIDEGVALLREALARGAVGPYQVQAAIGALHDEAARPEWTDWPQILMLYGLLGRMSDSPVVRLNHAVATAMVQGPDEGLRELAALDDDPRLFQSHRLDAVRAHLLERAGRGSEAIGYYQAAAAKTANLPERDYLQMKAARLAERK